jgi:uncharacterized protein GlcG (DUF336 family)
MTMEATARIAVATHIHLDLALALLDASRAEGVAIGVDVAVAVLDPSGVTVLSARSGEASFAAVAMAVDKAFTAAAWRMRTSAWATLSTPGAPGWGLAGSLSGRSVVIAGGVPIWDAEKRLLGGLGISGGLPEQDERVAERALARCRLTAEPG